MMYLCDTGKCGYLMHIVILIHSFSVSPSFIILDKLDFYCVIQIEFMVFYEKRDIFLTLIVGIIYYSSHLLQFPPFSINQQGIEKLKIQ